MRFISPANAYAQHIQAIFERRRSYGMTVHMSRHKEVNGYIFKVKFVDPRVHVVCVCVCVYAPEYNPPPVACAPRNVYRTLRNLTHTQYLIHKVRARMQVLRNIKPFLERVRLYVCWH